MLSPVIFIFLFKKDRKMTLKSDEGPWGSREPDQKAQRGPTKQSSVPFDVDALLRQFQSFFSSGPGKPKETSRLVLIGVVIACLLWLSTGIYKIQPNEQGVVLRFGRAVRVSQPGLNYRFPFPIETVWIRDVTAVNRIDSGISFMTREGGGSGEEAPMLTGDENLVDLQFTVLWVIKNIEQYLFTAKNPHETVQFAAESVVREIISQMPMMSILTQGRSVINHKAQESLQKLMDQYGLGIHIQEVVMGRIDPPSAVIDAYRDVQRAKADQERLINEAQAYRNSVVPVERGNAQQIIQKAHGYAQEVIAQAKGKTSRFLSVLSEYEKAPEVLSTRLYIEMCRNILKSNPKIVMDSQLASSAKGGGVLPVLPLMPFAQNPSYQKQEDSPEKSSSEKAEKTGG
jgi:membrane protease subunit HflK